MVLLMYSMVLWTTTIMIIYSWDEYSVYGILTLLLNAFVYGIMCLYCSCRLLDITSYRNIPQVLISASLLVSILTTTWLVSNLVGIPYNIGDSVLTSLLILGNIAVLYMFKTVYEKV